MDRMKEIEKMYCFPCVFYSTLLINMDWPNVFEFEFGVASLVFKLKISTNHLYA